MFRRRKAEEWQRILVRAKVPSTPVFNIRDVVRDPHIRHRGIIVRSEGDVSHLGPPMRFYKTKLKKTTPAPRIGQDTKEILRELGYSTRGIEKLKDSHVLG